MPADNGGLQATRVSTDATLLGKTTYVTSPLLNSDNAAALGALIDTLENASPGMVISGEDGLGKEAVVQMLYGRSSLRGYPFIKVNCPILSGSEKTGESPCINEIYAHPNHSHLSLFRMFHQGVLYLHRVDELERELQKRLLSILKRKFSTVGAGSGSVPSQVAIFSTASRPLSDRVSDGSFHPDLCDLLSGVSVHIPPLRHSPERIADLVDYFLKQSAMREKVGRYTRPSFPHLIRMRAYPWPGNVRELQALVKRAVRFNDWDAALATLNDDGEGQDDYTITHLTPESVALMPHFEITCGSMLDDLSEKTPSEELGLMDLVWYEEMVASNKMH